MFEVCDAVFDCRKCWFDLCLALRLSYDDLSAIRREHGGDTAACLREGLCLWLQSEKATWRALVDTMANSSGGNDLTLALEITRKHGGGMPIFRWIQMLCIWYSSSKFS